MASRANNRGDNFKIVAAITIGTPFAGYAYSSRTTFQRNPLKVLQKEQWHVDSKSRKIIKTATCLLLRKNMEFVAFGYEALEQYGHLKYQGKHKDYMLFRNFNLQLYNSQGSVDNIEIEDIDGHGQASARHIYSTSIRSLKNELLQQFDTGELLVNESDVRWVLTTSVCFPDDSRFFMSECAKQADIPADQLIVIYDHEAALVFCQYMEAQIPSTNSQTIGFDSDNTEYIVVKLAGKATEIDVLTKNKGKAIQTIRRRTDVKKTANSDICNDLVDNEFRAILINIFGLPVLNKIYEEKPESYMGLFRHLDDAKTAMIGPLKFVNISFPCKVFDALLKQHCGESLEDALKASANYNGSVQARLLDNRLLLRSDVFRSCFATTIDNTVALLEDVFSSNTARNISKIILLGHLADCELVQSAIRNHFTSKTLVIPDEPSIAVLKGAVMFGHNPSIIGMDDRRKVSSSNAYLAVVAIDFGTAYSGYAFSTTDMYKGSALKITVKNWKGQREYKTSTSVLLDAHKKLLKFGSDAQDEYAKIRAGKDLDSYYYFENFKMMLYGSKTPLRKLQLMDIQGKPNRTVLAQDVFSSAIKSLKEDAIVELTKNGTPADVDEIRWVLTVPAIWPDDAKLFMRESAKQAGIHSDKLLIALEPEVASVYAQYQETEQSTDQGYTVTAPGTKYLVADVGGGTTDITVHEKLHNGKLMELNKASGSGCGGRSVDNAFFELLDTMFGRHLVQRLKAEKTKSYLKLYRDFEDAKRTITPTTKESKLIKFPCQSFYGLMGGSEQFDNFTKKQGINMEDGKLVVDAKTIKNLFQSTIDNILTNIDSALKFSQSEEVSMIMLVGGFAKSKLLQEAIQTKFKSQRIIVPEDADLAVLKGAVLYGHNPETIDPRVTRYTYGVEMSTSFITGLHEPTRSYVDEFGKRYCHGTFARIIQQNKVVKLGTIVKRTYSIPPYTTETNIQFYTSEKDDPLYTDDRSCRKIGTLVISIPIPSEEQREVEVEYIFGNTEINVRAKETKYQKEALSLFTFE